MVNKLPESIEIYDLIKTKERTRTPCADLKEYTV